MPPDDASRPAVEAASRFEKPVVVLEDRTDIREALDYGEWMNRRLHACGFARLQCQFTSQPVSEGVLADLERTATAVQWSAPPAEATTIYVLSSRAGYSDDLERAADTRADVRLFELTDLVPA